MYVCVRVWKLRCIFEWSWTKLLHRLCPFVSLLGAVLRAHLEVFLPSQLVIYTWFLWSTCAQRCFKSDLPSHDTNSISTAALWSSSYKFSTCIKWYFVAKIVAPHSFFHFLDLKQHAVNRTVGPDFSYFNQKLSYAWSLRGIGKLLRNNLFAFFLYVRKLSVSYCINQLIVSVNL